MSACSAFYNPSTEFNKKNVSKNYFIASNEVAFQRSDKNSVLTFQKRNPKYERNANKSAAKRKCHYLLTSDDNHLRRPEMQG